MSRIDGGQTEDGIRWGIHDIPPRAQNPSGRVQVHVSVGRKSEDPFFINRERTKADPEVIDWAYRLVPTLVVQRRALLLGAELEPALPREPRALTQEELRERAVGAAQRRAKRAAEYADKIAAGWVPPVKEPAYKPERDPWVTAFVLNEANGHCERCGRGTHEGLSIVLEGHHVDDFSTYPERDESWNVIALCGCCHDLCPPRSKGPEAEAFNDSLRLILSYIRPRSADWQEQAA